MQNYLQKLNEYLLAAFKFFGLGNLNLSDPGSIIGSLASAFNYQGVELQGAIEVGLDRLDINRATGEDLDALGDNYALPRNDGTTAVGYVNLWSYEPPEDILMPSGTLFNNDSGQSFATTVDSVIFHDPYDYPATGDFLSIAASPFKNSYSRYYALPVKTGIAFDSSLPIIEQVEATIEIPVESIETGKTNNIDAHTIIQSGNAYLGGLNTITNETDEGVDNSLPFSGGSDEESDEVYRARIIEHLSGTSTTTKKYLENAALLPGIDDARIIEPEDENTNLSPKIGSVYLVVASARAIYNPRWAYEESVNNELEYPVDYPITPKEQVRNLVEDYRSVGVGIVVREAQIVRINFRNEEDENGDWIIFVKKGTNLLTYTQLIENRLRELLQSYEIGQNVYKSDIVDYVKRVDAVVDTGPFHILGDRWEEQTDDSFAFISYNSDSNYVGEGTVRREGLLVYNEEIARPDSSLRFRLVFDNAGD